MEERHFSRILCIRRENKNKWERRVALTPDDCQKLIKKGIRIIVQPSKLRCFTDKQYVDAGCELSEDIEEGQLILGVKEVPLEFLLPNKTYMYFSHTIKGQACNMPALKEILEKKIRLIDYECIKDGVGPNSQRLVAFGRFAGLAGGVDFLQGLGEFLLNKKYYTPFINTGYSYMFASVKNALESVKQVGNLISKKHLPYELCPFIIGITSNGRVSKGVQEVLNILPHEYIDPDHISSLFNKPPRTDIVYITIIESKHMYINKHNQVFTREDFYENPHNYKSVFSEKFIPYLSVLYHCMFWGADHPKILTLEEAHDLSDQKRFRLLGISDITCDIDGSIELLQKCTNIENPFYTIDPLTNIIADDFNKMSENSILYHAVDHLPAEFPIDASKHFSEKLSPFIEKILDSDYPCNYDDYISVQNKENLNDSVETGSSNILPPEILNACETWNGKLMPNYEYLYKDLSKFYPDFRNSSNFEKERKSN